MKVSTTSGVVQGRDNTFWNIPYAAPLVGAARFAAPTSPPSWDGVRDATEPGATAPAPDRRWFGRLDLGPLMGPGWVRGNDYLTVNVWTPSTVGRAPVMVFVHGGGFLSGSGSAPLYDGSTFARDGVVLVTLNYRLGATGWLDLPGAPANRGLLDVLAALRWVRENIAGFGGDPDQVTVFGQSAGAMIVSALLATQEADGLFRRAISQSGGLALLPKESAEHTGQALAEQLGIAYTVEGFAGISDDDLIAAVPKLAAGMAGVTPFGVVLEPPTALLDVDLLAGTNSEESKLYQDPSRSAVIDEIFRASTRLLVETHGRAHTYEFDWRDGPYGACHAVELPFVFDNTAMPALRGQDGLLGPEVPPTLAQRMHEAWVRFAMTGDAEVTVWS